jgi:hypothetical protein
MRTLIVGDGNIFRGNGFTVTKEPFQVIYEESGRKMTFEVELRVDVPGKLSHEAVYAKDFLWDYPNSPVLVSYQERLEILSRLKTALDRLLPGYELID